MMHDIETTLARNIYTAWNVVIPPPGAIRAADTTTWDATNVLVIKSMTIGGLFKTPGRSHQRRGVYLRLSHPSKDGITELLRILNMMADKEQGDWTIYNYEEYKPGDSYAEVDGHDMVDLGGGPIPTNHEVQLKLGSNQWFCEAIGDATPSLSIIDITPAHATGLDMNGHSLTFTWVGDNPSTSDVNGHLIFAEAVISPSTLNGVLFMVLPYVVAGEPGSITLLGQAPRTIKASWVRNTPVKFKFQFGDIGTGDMGITDVWIDDEKIAFTPTRFQQPLTDDLKYLYCGSFDVHALGDNWVDNIQGTWVGGDILPRETKIDVKYVGFFKNHYEHQVYLEYDEVTTR